MKYTTIALGFSVPGAVPRTFILTVPRVPLEGLKPGEVLELAVAKAFPKTEWTPRVLYHVLRKSVSITKASKLEKAYVSNVDGVLNFYVGSVFAEPIPYDVVMAMFNRPKNVRHAQV